MAKAIPSSVAIFPETGPPPPYPHGESAGPSYRDNSADEQLISPGRRLLCIMSGAERIPFIRSVFGILTLQTLMVTGIIAVCVFVPQVETHFQEIGFFRFWAWWVGILGIVTLITVFNHMLRKSPVPLIIAVLIVFFSGYLVGSISARFDWNVAPVISGGITSVLLLCVVLYTVHPAKFDHIFRFTPIRTMLYVWGLSAIAWAIAFGVTLDFEYASYLVGIPMALVTYFLATPHILMKDERMELKAKEYVYCAAQILMYLVNVGTGFLRICPCCRCMNNCCGNACTYSHGSD